MALGTSLGAFAESFAASRQDRKDREQRSEDNARQDRMLDFFQSQANAPIATPGSTGIGLGVSTSNGGSGSWRIPTGDIADRIRNGFIDRGMAPHIAEAFVWNGQDESGLRADINEEKPLVAGSRGGYGIWQHTGPRRRALEAYAASVGKPVGDLDTQMDFVMQELQGSEKGAWTAISATKTPGEAAAAVVNRFLRPAAEHRQRRADAYLKAIPKAGSAMGALRPIS